MLVSLITFVAYEGFFNIKYLIITVHSIIALKNTPAQDEFLLGGKMVCTLESKVVYLVNNINVWLKIQFLILN